MNLKRGAQNLPCITFAEGERKTFVPRNGEIHAAADDPTCHASVHGSGKRNLAGDAIVLSYDAAPKGDEIERFANRFGLRRFAQDLPRPHLGVGTHDVSLSRLHHTAYALPVYGSCCELPRTHATLGSGCWANLAERDWLPAGFH